MPLVDVKVLAGVFNPDQKAEIIEKMTDVMAEIEGEHMREKTWVTIQEVDVGSWGVGGESVSVETVKT
ncbi:MAG: tautomerase family protein [Proteobacteria bacterium]|nr:tautomerase family protein [Pseudomonadota bacterium]